MAGNEVTVGDPGAISPRLLRRPRGGVRVGAPDVRDGREDHRVEAKFGQPVLEIDSTRFFQAEQTLSK